MKILNIFRFPCFAFYIAPAVGAAMVTGAASLGSGMISGVGSKRAAKEAGKQNRAMYYLQRQDYLADRAHAEEYDSAAAQRARLEEAGLNPYLMMSGDAGSAQSPANISTHPYESANAGEAVAAGLQNGVTQAISILRDEKLRQLNAEKVSADIRKVDAETNFQNIANKSAEARFLADLGVNRAKIRQMTQEFSHASDMFPVSLATAQQQLTNLQDSHYLNMLDYELKSLQSQKDGIILKYLDSAQQLDLSMKFAQIRAMSDKHQLDEQQMQKNVQELTSMIRENSLHDFTPSEMRDLRSAIYNELIETKRSNTYNAQLNNAHSGAYDGIPGLSSFVQGVDQFLRKFNPLQGVFKVPL